MILKRYRPGYAGVAQLERWIQGETIICEEAMGNVFRLALVVREEKTRTEQ